MLTEMNAAENPPADSFPITEKAKTKGDWFDSIVESNWALVEALKAWGGQVTGQTTQALQIARWSFFTCLVLGATMIGSWVILWQSSARNAAQVETLERALTKCIDRTGQAPLQAPPN